MRHDTRARAWGSNLEARPPDRWVSRLGLCRGLGLSDFSQMRDIATAVVLTVTPALARHVAACLAHGRIHLQEHWQAPPDGARDLEHAMRGLSQPLTSDQEQPIPAETGDIGHGDDMAPRLLTYEDVAAVLSVSVSTVRRLVSAGELPAVSVGDARRVHTDDLSAYLDELLAQRGAIAS